MKPKLIELINLLYEEEQRTGQVYMPKILSEGCLCELTWKDGYKETVYYSSEKNIRGGIGFLSFFTTKRVEKINFKNDKVKILGHLGLSSILNYISSIKKPGYAYKSISVVPHIIHIIQYNTVTEVEREIGEIPNKEPHLMTDQELDNLITLIKKLGEL